MPLTASISLAFPQKRNKLIKSNIVGRMKNPSTGDLSSFGKLLLLYLKYEIFIALDTFFYS